MPAEPLLASFGSGFSSTAGWFPNREGVEKKSKVVFSGKRNGGLGIPFTVLSGFGILA